MVCGHGVCVVMVDVVLLRRGVMVDVVLMVDGLMVTE